MRKVVAALNLVVDVRGSSAVAAADSSQQRVTSLHF
jgi:hypothetical protein